MTNNARVTARFDQAAMHYDAAAKPQALIAERLVSWAAESGIKPKKMLDLGCGTGLVTAELRAFWPQAKIAVLDASSSMLEQAKHKVPDATAIESDALTLPTADKFDVIFSSMLLHWLPDARAAIERWRGWLNPGGMLFVAVPVAGSFSGWRDLCHSFDYDDGLWPLPAEDFADDIATRKTLEAFAVPYPSARDFLKSMKLAGAGTPRAGHQPFGTARMRALLNAAARPFYADYRIAFLALRN